MILAVKEEGSVDYVDEKEHGVRPIIILAGRGNELQDESDPYALEHDVGRS